MSLNNRLEEARAYYKLSKKEFSQTAGIPQNSYSQIISGTEPRYKFLNKILNHYKELNARWLMTGEGEMLTNIHWETENNKKAELENEVLETSKHLIAKKRTDDMEKDIIMNIHNLFDELARLRAENNMLKSILNKNEE